MGELGIKFGFFRWGPIACANNNLIYTGEGGGVNKLDLNNKNNNLNKVTFYIYIYVTVLYKN